MAADDLELMKTGIEAVASSALKPVTDLISSIFGPAAEEAGLMLKDHVRVFRAMRQLRLYQRTAEIFAKTGAKPQQVPLKLLFPIIENASVEETDELQDRWANLLAHAADPDESSIVSISFPTILRELSARQVKFLDTLYDEAIEHSQRTKNMRIEYVSFDYTDLSLKFSDASLARHPSGRHVTMAESQRDDVEADRQEIGVALDIFMRHRIMEEVYDIPERRSGQVNWEPEIDSSFQFTLLGARFVAACREPKSKSPNISKASK